METYDNFLALKDHSDIWRKAKQREFNSLDQILLALGNLDSLTWRNAMTLRMLGLIGKPDAGSKYEVGLTEAGQKLLESTNKQLILDEQLLKLYLASYVNTSLVIPVFATAVIYEILSRFKSLSFEEYSLFVCWINTTEEKTAAMTLIEKYRNADEETKKDFHEKLKTKVAELGYVDFNDHIYRLFGMFKLSSFISSESIEGRWSDLLVANSEPSTYKSLVESAASLDITNYETLDTKFLGISNVTPDYSDITSEMSTLSAEEQRIIRKQLLERNRLPDIATVQPKLISAEMLEVRPKEPNRTGGSSKPIKIDYERRDKRNRLVGAYGERIVVKYEYNKLVAAGRSDLAAKIEHASVENDSLGYDVKSFESSATEKHIEVKTVSGKPKSFRFYLSKNELSQITEDKNHCIYIVLNYETTEPEILEIGNLKASIDSSKAVIEPVNYTVTVNLSYDIS